MPDKHSRTKSYNDWLKTHPYTVQRAHNVEGFAAGLVGLCLKSWLKITCCVHRTVNGNVTMMLTLMRHWFHDPVQRAQRGSCGPFMMSSNICSIASVAQFKQSNLVCNHYCHCGRLPILWHSNSSTHAADFSVVCLRDAPFSSSTLQTPKAVQQYNYSIATFYLRQWNSSKLNSLKSIQRFLCILQNYMHIPNSDKRN